MKEFIDKLIERLEEAKVSANRRNAFDSEVSYACAIDIVNQLAEEYKDKSSIIDDLKAFLKEKFKYNSEQVEIWADGSDTDSYFRQQKDLYMDRANIYGEVMREIDRLSEEYKLFGNSEQVKGGWISCSERLPGEIIKDCLVTLENGAVFQASYSQIGEEFRMICWHGIERFSEENRVIAWMPLPAPYTEGESR